MKINEYIKSHRLAAGLSQKELGELVGVSQQAIAQYEKGQNSPRTDTIKKIAKALNLSFTEFLDDDYFDLTDKPQSVEEEFLKKKFQDILCLDISEEEKEKLLQEHITNSEILSGIHENNVYGAQKFLLNHHFEKLNSTGQQEAVKRVEELTEIPKYQRETEK